MSYARFGADGSSVYVFMSTSGYLECCGCSLTPDGPFETGTTIGMIAHLRAHTAAGGTVPASVIPAIVADAAENFPPGTVPCRDHGRVSPDHECLATRAREGVPVGDEDG